MYTENEILFKTFKTFQHSYVYDRHTNALIMITDEEYNELNMVQGEQLSPDQCTTIKKYQELGMFQPNTLKHICHPSTSIIEQHLRTRMKQLTLQVTQQCNLRCKYCVYSGIYKGNRTHSNQRMSITTALKAIDFFLERNVEISDAVIGFYGGEPLLEIDLIKKCIEYARSRVEGRRILFNMTSNGTLLTDSIVDYLVDNDIMLSISLDGSKAEHDLNRRFPDGSGSFDIIISNITRVRERYPEFFKRISIMTTINPHSDLGCVLEYFNSEDIFSDTSIMFNEMSKNSFEGDIISDDRAYAIRNYEYIKMLFSLIGKFDPKYVSPLVLRSIRNAESKLKHIHNHTALQSVSHHGGPCIPGVRKLFVRVDGTLFPCERVNEELDYFIIGTLENGINIAKARKILNNGELSESECKSCWALRHCLVCSSQIESSDEPTRNNKLKICPNNENTVLFDLVELCVLREYGYENGNMERLSL